jgi:glyoxylase-like metal-dependent hydrolase (beta-lactamase superfamily II)
VSAPPLRVLNAGNQGPFTLDGTRSYVVGLEAPTVIDPGPDVQSHVRALVHLLDGAARVTLALTHGHADHAGAAERVREHTGAALVGPGHELARPLEDGARVATDAGDLVAIHTPGHTPDHLCYHWPEGSAVFVGDLLLGRGSTTWVAGYPGCVADYLGSLERIAGLDVERLLPAHGPALEQPAAAIERFRSHRLQRIEQVQNALAERPELGMEDLLDTVYGSSLPKAMRPAAEASLEAILDYVHEN